jgi:hypothetical protein
MAGREIASSEPEQRNVSTYNQPQEETMDRCLRTVLWRNDQARMFEYCALKDTRAGILLEGVMVTAVDGRPLRAAYQVTCDRQGLTRSVVVETSGGLGSQAIRLGVNDRRVWRREGKELPECAGLADVDLGFSPSTNTLPIRRLKLAPGQSQEITAVWVRFPELDVLPFPQRYTCLAPGRYRFESLLSDFQAELAVDEHGMVRQYGRLWLAEEAGQDC